MKFFLHTSLCFFLIFINFKALSQNKADSTASSTMGWNRAILTDISQNKADSTASSTSGKTMPSIQAGLVNLKKKINFKHRAADHVIVQFGYSNFLRSPDSIGRKVKGFGNTFSTYVMYDILFKQSPHFSFAFGLGVSAASIYFEDTYIDIKANSTVLPFVRPDSTNTFKKYKLTTVGLELPIELRYYSNPANTNKSFKAAIGVKLGLVVNAHTKGKNLIDSSGANIYNKNYIRKEKDTKFFNLPRATATVRLGYSLASVFFDYQINSLIKTTAGGPINPFTVGISIGGL